MGDLEKHATSVYLSVASVLLTDHNIRVEPVSYTHLDVFQESGLISYHFKEGMLNILLKPYEGKADISGSVVLATLQSLSLIHI